MSSESPHSARLRLGRASVCAASVIAVGLAACAVTNDEPTASSAQAIAWGSTDTGTSALDQLKRDVVVKLRGPTWECTGSLLTPRIVLTASHCLRGDTGAGTSRHDDTPWVAVGENANAAKYQLQAYAAVPYIDHPVETGDDYQTATDIALVFLPAPASGTRVLGMADYAISTRPSFSSLGSGGAAIAGFAPENLVDGLRQVGTVPYTREDVHDARYFSTYGAALRPGDSGGPLFDVRSDGTRDIMGVNSEYSWNTITDPHGHSSREADITSPLLSQWITKLAEDNTRSDAWYKQHGVTKGNYWIGEADYTGTCQAYADKDCDHWNDAHDNCPGTFNPDQADSDSNGIGDACPPAPPPPPPPIVCSGYWTCEGSGTDAYIQCSPPVQAGYGLYRLTATGYHPVSTYVQPWSTLGTPPTSSMHEYGYVPSASETTLTYEACSKPAFVGDPIRCSAPITLSNVGQCACHPATCASSLACNTSVSDGCGGTIQCGACADGSVCVDGACSGATCKPPAGGCLHGKVWDPSLCLCSAN